MKKSFIILVALFCAMFANANAQTKFFEVKSGSLDVPVVEIQEFVGSQNFSAVSDWDKEKAFPNAGEKTNLVYGREYARYRLDALLAEFDGQVVKSRVDLLPSNKAGFWITIDTTVNKETSTTEVTAKQLDNSEQMLLQQVYFLQNRISGLEKKHNDDSVANVNKAPERFTKMKLGMAMVPNNNSNEFAWGGIAELEFPISQKSEISLGGILNGGFQGQGLVTPYVDFATVLVPKELSLVIGAHCSFARNRDLSAPSPYRTFKNAGIGAGIKFWLGPVESKLLIGATKDVWMSEGNFSMTNLQGFARIQLSVDPLGLIRGE